MVTSAPTSAPVVIITHSLMVTVYVLASLYAALALVPVIQLIRIHRRVPHIGWTLQKIFLVLTFVVNTIRASFFLTVPELDNDTFFLANFKYPIFTVRRLLGRLCSSLLSSVSSGLAATNHNPC